jgi:8-oxo-dGTP pyrophosphatase MutT (NUDIX family)
MKRIPYASIIVENMEGEVLLLLRDNQSTTVYPNQWTLVGGKVEEGETPETAAQRLLEEETGLQARLSFWKRYDREHLLFTADQHIFTAKVEDACDVPVLGRSIQFFRPDEIEYLRIGYGFKLLLNEYRLKTMDHMHVHHS